MTTAAISDHDHAADDVGGQQHQAPVEAVGDDAGRDRQEDVRQDARRADDAEHERVAWIRSQTTTSSATRYSQSPMDETNSPKSSRARAGCAARGDMQSALPLTPHPSQHGDVSGLSATLQRASRLAH